MRDERLRTSAFMLPPDRLGEVYGYHAGPRFVDAWKEVDRRWQKLGRANAPSTLPYRSLYMALRLLARDFIRIKAERLERDPFFIVSRTPIKRKTLEQAFFAWESAILGDEGGDLLIEALDDLQGEPHQLEREVEVVAGECPRAPGWVWDAAIWDFSRRLSASPLEVDGRRLHLRLDSAAQLLAWGDLIEAEDPQSPDRAMPRVNVRMVTVPGRREPALLLNAIQSCLTSRWFGVGHAWVNRGDDQPILDAEVRWDWETRRMVWQDRAVEVLKQAQLHELPDPDEQLLEQFGEVRALHPSREADASHGPGVGPLFYEAMAFWARRQLELEPIMLTRVLSSVPRVHRAEVDVIPTSIQLARAVQAAGGPLRIVCLYHDGSVRDRMLRTLAKLIPSLESVRERLENGEVYRTDASIEVVFRSPPGSEILTQLETQARIQAWVQEAMVEDLETRTPVAALIETLSVARRSSNENAQRGSQLIDPKPVLRTCLAQRGIVSQFIASDSFNVRKFERYREKGKELEDYAAIRAIWDLFRSAGVFPLAAPSVTGFPDGTWVVGIHVKRLSGKSPAMKGRPWRQNRIISIVAMQTGSHRCLAFDRRDGWLALREVTARQHALLDVMGEEETRQQIETALTALTKRGEGPMAVFFEAGESRYLWSGLQDTGAPGFPEWMAQSGIAITRVRVDRDEVPSIAGAGSSWVEPIEIKPITRKDAVFALESADHAGGHYYITASEVLQQNGEHRDRSRYHRELTADGLSAPWHTLTVREFWSRHPGAFKPLDLARLGTLFCRYAPTWHSDLRYPAPLHLAEALVNDSPQR